MRRRIEKAISPVVATVLLVAIAIALALSLYAAQQGWLADQLAGLSRTSSTVVVEEAFYNGTGEFVLYVRNAGAENVNISRVYIEHPDGYVELVNINPEITIAPGDVAAVSATSAKAITSGAVYRLQVVADDGATASTVVRT